MVGERSERRLNVLRSPLPQNFIMSISHGIKKLGVLGAGQMGELKLTSSALQCILKFVFMT